MRGMNEWLVVGGWERMDACMHGGLNVCGWGEGGEIQN